MTKKMVIIRGSPRKNGNSASLAKQVEYGAKSMRAETQSFYLHGMNIEPCTACDTCREKPEVNCVIDDDMQIIYPAVRLAEVIVIASPIYWFTVSAQTKLFMDRCYGLWEPQGYLLAGKRIGIVLSYADPDPFVSGAVNALRTFQDMVNYIGAEIVGMVYGSARRAGEIKRNKELMDSAYRLGIRLVTD
ncbi:MAG: flavodoxin family protein [Desulfobacterales bacterium]|jgi:multimeric flavodoxin WrbA